MPAIHIDDLSALNTLDQRAMSSIRGKGAPWVFGWIRPYMPPMPSAVPVINFYQINNYAEQMNNQFQVVDVANSAPNSQVSVLVNQQASNAKPLVQALAHS